MATDLLVVTGRRVGGGIPVDFFTRLAADLAALEVPVVADVHGDELDALLEGGPLHLLKLSQETALAAGPSFAAADSAGPAAGMPLLAHSITAAKCG